MEDLFQSHLCLFCCHDFSPYNPLLLFLLIRLQRETERPRKKLYEVREKTENICCENEAVASELKFLNQTATERKSKEVYQPDLLSALIRAVEDSSADDDSSCFEHLCSVKNIR